MSKKFIRTEGTKITFTHFMPFDEQYGMGKTEEELLKEGYLIDEIPDPEQKEGKTAEAHYTPERGYYYEYIDTPPAPEETGIAELKEKIEKQGKEIEEQKKVINVLLGVE